MVNKMFCDRCGVHIPPTMRHSEVELNDDHHGSYHDYCDRCTQSLKMWMQNLPNREVKYLEMGHPILENGSFGDVVARLRDGACAAHFYRQGWVGEGKRGGYLGFTEADHNIHTVRVLTGDGRSDDLTDEDFLASDWMEFRWVDIDVKGEDEGDEEGDE